jgi:hypothetical protein
MHIETQHYKTSFLHGMAALIYCPALIGAHGYSSAAEADMGALCSDWLEIAKDMHQAINAYEPEQ